MRSVLAAHQLVVRFTYATDPGLARPGWFVDDVKITAGDQLLYSSDFEQAEDPAICNGGSRDALQTAPRCTKGWQHVSAVDGDPADNYSDPASSDGKWRFAYGCLGFQVDAMTGDDVPAGPSPAPGDPVGDVSFTMGSGCATFDYGYGGVSNAVSVPGVDLTPKR